jgi:hypothetical protein
MAGVRHRLDLFGVLVLSFAAAGGITHDLLIGAVPPGSIADWRYIVVPGWLAGDVLGPSVGPAVAEPRARFRCCRVGAVRCCRRAQGARLPTQPSRGDDARGCDRRRRGWSRTCCGGSPPTCLRRAVRGRSARRRWWPTAATPVRPAGDYRRGQCFGLRLLAIRRGWGLPVARAPERPSGQDKEGPARHETRSSQRRHVPTLSSAASRPAGRGWRKEGLR